jgi:hypothetical protein
MANVLDSDDLKKIQIDGLDLVLVLSLLTLEIAAEISPADAQGAVAAIANRIDTFAKGIPEPRMNLIFSQLARFLIAAERTA